jgi:hypothetical protein
MARYADREHAIPLRKPELVRLLLRHLDSENPAELTHFRELCRLIEAILHFEFHERLECVKELYAPFDPDTVAVYPVSGIGLPPASSASAAIDTSQTSSQAPGTTRTESHAATLPSCPARRKFAAESSIEATSPGKLLEQVRYLLERGNFRRLDRAVLEEAMRRPGRWGLNFEVNFDLFEILELYARGDTVEKEKRPARLFGLIPEKEMDVAVYERLVLIVRFRADAQVPPFVDKNCLYIKLFKDVPKDDLEMLIPGTEIRIRPLDGLKIGMPLLLGILTCLWKLVMGAAITIASGAAGILAWLGIIGAPLSYGVRSYFGYVSTRQKYQLTVTQCLFFQNLDNNLGAITHLIDEAEEQEFREILLSWFFLWRFAGPQGWTAEALDDHVEQYLEREAQLRVDFEIEDALAKLVRYGLAEQDEQGRWRAIPLLTACERLDARWDNFFRYNRTLLEPEPGAPGKSEN